MDYPYDNIYSSGYTANPTGYPSFDVPAAGSATTHHSFMPNEFESVPHYPSQYYPVTTQPNGNTWPAPAQGEWFNQLNSNSYEATSYPATSLDDTVATGLPHNSEYTSDWDDRPPFEQFLDEPVAYGYSELPTSVSDTSQYQPVESSYSQQHSLETFPHGSVSYPPQTSDYPDLSQIPFNNVNLASLDVAPAPISMEQPQSERHVSYLPDNAQPATTAYHPAASVASASHSPNAYPYLKQHHYPTPKPSSEAQRSSVSSSHLPTVAGTRHGLKRKEAPVPVPSHPTKRTAPPETPLGSNHDAWEGDGVVGYYREHVHNNTRPPPSTVKNSQKSRQRTKAKSKKNARAPSFVSASPHLAHLGSRVARATLPASNNSSNASTSSLPVAPTGPMTPPATPLISAATPRWVDPFGGLCSDGNWAETDEEFKTLRNLAKRKQKGFTSNDEAEVLRHDAIHRADERWKAKSKGISAEERTQWNHQAIDAQIALDRAHPGGFVGPRKYLIKLNKLLEMGDY
ncbi:hypothetical protein FRC07_006359 [Ceratobasidium sp. 392]|nr:hypothetical protein FRC07_006359 [Ceratobasidium sp. 392]